MYSLPLRVIPEMLPLVSYTTVGVLYALVAAAAACAAASCLGCGLDFLACLAHVHTVDLWMLKSSATSDDFTLALEYALTTAFLIPVGYETLCPMLLFVLDFFIVFSLF